ncbi:NADH dehydrogenase [ubiquinone] flavoprotein 1, mitochondrial [Stygiomarasmius scandens]|uniref:NADH dehydrogenase [ubiquinone] flavoprotein 1, mitochondrial n=1 Tax=Marasmiellus scandens TaxID=2682957 RepID=A0ABR1J1G6_9AGAR
MSDLTRTAKSGSDWSVYELTAYNITVHTQPSIDFLGPGHEPSAPLDNLDPLFVSGTLDEAELAESDFTFRLFQYLKFATKINVGQASAINDLVRELLRLLGYEERGLLFRSNYAIPLLICSNSESCDAQTDICLVRGGTILLIIKIVLGLGDPSYGPQVIAAAIAAFQQNNRTRGERGLQRLDKMVIPCVVMIGTRPVFYKVPVTKELSDAVAVGHYPAETTFVDNCYVVPPSRRVTEGITLFSKKSRILRANKHPRIPHDTVQLTVSSLAEHGICGPESANSALVEGAQVPTKLRFFSQVPTQPTCSKSSSSVGVD